MKRTLLVALLALTTLAAAADEPETAATAPQLSQFGPGDGPSVADGVLRLLDSAGTPEQSNAVAFDRAKSGAFESVSFTGRMRVLEGGDGGAFLFLNTREYGVRGPAPFLASWVEPNLRATFAVGIDVHNPPSEEPFTPWGNYQDLPQREISLHWDGREIVKRVAKEEFRGAFANFAVTLQHVVGGAEVSVRIGDATVYDRYFIGGLLPYEMRLAIGAGTRADAATEFDVADIAWETTEPARKRRPPLHVEVFNHVLTDNQKTAFTSEVALPPRNWAYGRVLMTLEIHDAGPDWDEWDRNGEVSVMTDDGKKLGIVPFITSYRTECHWTVDVTHFRPLLAGSTTFEIAAGTTFYKNRGYMMSLSLDFYHGTPALEAYRVVPLWIGTAHYRSAENHFRDFFTPTRVAIDEEAVAGRAYVTTTGHTQIGEFAPSDRTLVFLPNADAEPAPEHRFANRLWKTDCYLNPNRPQYGTWQYSRAGWAPGDVVRPWQTDLTHELEPGREAEFRYEPEPYDFGGPEGRRPPDKQINEARHVVRAYLVLYRRPSDMMSAPILQIVGVAGGSNAAKAGLIAGDFLARYDGQVLESVDDLRGAIQAAQAAGKEKIPVVVFRGGERVEVELGPGKMGVNLAAR